MPRENSDELKSAARVLGFTTVGICEAIPAPHYAAYRDWVEAGMHAGMGYLRRQLPLRASPQALLPEARSIIAVTLNYNQTLTNQAGEPKIARYALGRDYHKVLRAKLKGLGSWLAQKHPGSKIRACVDSAPILEREYAQLAGLGWFGKNTCLIDSQRGSWFLIGLLLTSVEFEPDKPASGGCGTCRKCIDACPTGAIVERDGRWMVDSHSCISYLTIEHRGDFPAGANISEWTFGCDVCQEVCPFNEARESQPLRARVTTEPDFLRRRDWPSLTQLAQIGREDWEKLTPGSPVRRAGYEGIRRNARHNLSAEGG